MTRTRVNVTPQLAIGICIMAAGILLTLDRLHIAQTDRLLRFWPAALVAVGVTIWVRRPDRQGRFWGSVWIFVGAWLLLNTLGLVRVGFWELFWPLVLVLVGLKLVMHTVSRPAEQQDTAARRGVTLLAILGESKRSSDDKPFRGGQMTAIMGGCQLDLRQATMAPGDEAPIDLFALMGGLEIWLPSSWAVATDVVPILGGVEDKRLPAVADARVDRPAEPPRVLLRGHVVLGGLTIRN
jgi:predicted membrane protein